MNLQVKLLQKFDTYSITNKHSSNLAHFSGVDVIRMTNTDVPAILIKTRGEDLAIPFRDEDTAKRSLEVLVKNFSAGDILDISDDVVCMLYVDFDSLQQRAALDSRDDKLVLEAVCNMNVEGIV